MCGRKEGGTEGQSGQRGGFGEHNSLGGGKIHVNILNDILEKGRYWRGGGEKGGDRHPENATIWVYVGSVNKKSPFHKGRVRKKIYQEKATGKTYQGKVFTTVERGQKKQEQGTNASYSRDRIKKLHKTD